MKSLTNRILTLLIAFLSPLLALQAQGVSREALRGGPMFTVSLIAMGAFLLLLLGYYGISRYLEHRRRQRELEQQAKFDLMNKLAKQVDNPVSFTADISLDKKERNEMLENAREMARKNPKQAADVMRNWMSD